MITRIILQKHKYDIQIFPNYSWITVLFEKILKVKDIMKYFLSKWFSLKRSFERYFYLLRTLTFVIPYWTYWSLVILSTGHMRTRSYENTPHFVSWESLYSTPHLRIQTLFPTFDNFPPHFHCQFIYESSLKRLVKHVLPCVGSDIEINKMLNITCKSVWACEGQ